MELNYCWHSEVFELHDIKISYSIELQQLDEDGEWIERDPLDSIGIIFADSDKEEKFAEYEKMENVKYSKLKRTLTAKASSNDCYIYLGVPEDKQAISTNESEIDYFDFVLREAEAENLEDIVRWGAFGYLKYNSEFRVGGAYASFYVPTSVFDEIESLLTQTGVEFQINVNKKGWQGGNSFGNSEIYIDTEKKELAEFAGITVIHKFKNTDTSTLQEKENISFEHYFQRTIEDNMYNFEKLTELTSYMRTIDKLAKWFTALGIVYIWGLFR
jgi:hypothetical protein